MTLSAQVSYDSPLRSIPVSHTCSGTETIELSRGKREGGASFPSWQEELRERADVNSRSGVQSAPSSNLAKDHENQSCPCHTGHHRERRDRTSSGEVEADKLAGPAHALLSE